MLLIQNHESKWIQRHEHRGTGSHHHQGLIRIQTALPSTQAFAVPTAAVILQDPGSEAPATAVHDLWNESDFRCEQQNVPARRQFCSGELQVHLGLP